MSYDRRILQRVRTVMARENPKCLIDLHSNTGFSIGSANHYAEFMPYLDRTWFGESFRYAALSPDQWLVQVSGIPFGVMGEMLQAGGHPWRGAVYGLTNRLGWNTDGVRCDPRPVWKVWDRFGITDAEMIGWWDSACPVQCETPAAKATVFRNKDSCLIALANWSEQKIETKLRIDWKLLGIDPAKAVLFAPRSPGFQKFARWKPADAIPIAGGRGWLIIVDEKGPVAGKDDADTMAGRPVMLDEGFAKGLPGAWRAVVSSRPGTAVKPAAGGMEVVAEANVAAGIERSLLPGAGAVEGMVSTGSDRGETWGVGMALVWPDGKTVRINARMPESRFGVDVTGRPQKFTGKLVAGEVRFRFRLEADRIIGEAACAGLDDEWQELVVLERQAFAGLPEKVRIGKECGADGMKDYEKPGTAGTSVVRGVRWYR